MAEPLIGESITDIDSNEAGETEVDLTGGIYHGREGLTWGTGTAEIEIRLTRRLGVSLEIAFAGAQDHGFQGALNAGLSVALWHDYRRDLHFQFEARALVSDGQLAPARLRPIPDDGAEPYAFGLRGAWRRRWLTLRFGLGPSIAGHGGSVPIWADAAILFEWGARRGVVSFAGVEVVTDWASASPVVISPEVALAFRLGEVPVRVGLGVPCFVANRDRGPSVGAVLRIVFEFERD